MSTLTLPNGDEFLLLPEVAAALRCSVKTVRRLIAEGKIVAHKVRGRVVVLKSAFRAYVEKITAGAGGGSPHV
jgi:excisionase family DNA binding protein